jgi:hypothetical protein
MYKVKTRNRLDLIDCWGVSLAVTLHLYKGGGLDPVQTVSRANPVVLGNKSCEKLGTLTDSASRGPSDLRAGPSARHFWCSTKWSSDSHLHLKHFLRESGSDSWQIAGAQTEICNDGSELSLSNSIRTDKATKSRLTGITGGGRSCAVEAAGAAGSKVLLVVVVVGVGR